MSYRHLKLRVHSSTHLCCDDTLWESIEDVFGEIFVPISLQHTTRISITRGVATGGGGCGGCHTPPKIFKNRENSGKLRENSGKLREIKVVSRRPEYNHIKTKLEAIDTSQICFNTQLARTTAWNRGWIWKITVNVLRSHCQPRLGAIVSWALK